MAIAEDRDEFYALCGGPQVPAVPGKFTVTSSGSLLMVVGTWEQGEFRHQLIMQIRQGGEFRLHNTKRKRHEHATDETER